MKKSIKKYRIEVDPKGAKKNLALKVTFFDKENKIKDVCHLLKYDKKKDSWFYTYAAIVFQMHYPNLLEKIRKDFLFKKLK